MTNKKLISVFSLIVIIGSGIFISHSLGNLSTGGNQAALAKNATTTADSKGGCSITYFTSAPVIGSPTVSKLAWTSTGCKTITLQPKDTALGENAGSIGKGNALTNTTVAGNGTFTTPALLNAFTYTLTGTSTSLGNAPVSKTVAIPVANQGVATSPCKIDSFVLPASTTLSTATLTATIKTSNCNNAFAVINSGSYYQGYNALPVNGSYTFAMQTFPKGTISYSKKDATLDVTFFAGSVKNITSVTKSVKLSDSIPSSNQCNLTVKANATSVAAGQKVTISWNAPDAPTQYFPDGCLLT